MRVRITFLMELTLLLYVDPLLYQQLIMIFQKFSNKGSHMLKIGHLNINSIRNKFGTLDNIVKASDIFFISELKLDNTFPINQFAIGGHKVFRRDRNQFGDGLILYINENIPCKPLSNHTMFSDLELMTFELHQNKRKWLFLGIYKPHFQNDIEFLRSIFLILDYYLPTYESFVVIVDFNQPVEKSHLEAIIQAYNLKQSYQKMNLLSISYSKLH